MFFYLNTFIGLDLVQHPVIAPAKHNVGLSFTLPTVKVYSLNSGKVSIQIQLKALPELGKWTRPNITLQGAILKLDAGRGLDLVQYV